MHAQQSEAPGLVGERSGLSKESNSDTNGPIDDQGQIVPWWEEWGTADNEWGELDRSEWHRQKK